MSIEISQLTFERKTFRLGPLDLTLPDRTRSALLGPSGCGKTTLLRLIAGLEAPASGRISFGGRDQTTVPPQARGVALVFQNLALWPHMSSVEQVRYAGQCSAAEAEAWLERVGLPGKGDRLPRELSGGEGQRVALARALAQRPRVLLLDEPLRSVDPHLRSDLQRTIREIASEAELTTVIVTHDREEALALGEHLVLMHEGKVIEAGPAEQLLERPSRSFTAAFLSGASLFALERDGDRLASSLGTFTVPEHVNGSATLFLAVSPTDLTVSTEGQGVEVALVDVIRAPAGLVGEVELEGQRLQVTLDHPLPLGTKLRLRLRRTPPIVTGDAN